MLYEVRYIEWVDSMGGSGWEPLDDMQTYKPMAIKTAGFVVAEGEDFVTILQSYDEREKGRPHADNVISIPKIAITKSLTLSFPAERYEERVAQPADPALLNEVFGPAKNGAH